MRKAIEMTRHYRSVAAVTGTVATEVVAEIVAIFVSIKANCIAAYPKPTMPASITCQRTVTLPRVQMPGPVSSI